MNNLNPPLPKARMKVQYPGKIVYVTPSGQSFHGCATQRFNDSEAMNGFFRDNPGYLLVDLKLYGDTYLCVYTAALEDEDLELLKDHGQAIEKVREEITKERLTLAQKQEEEAAKQQAETNRLVSVGVKCEADHLGIKAERDAFAQFKKRVRANVSKDLWVKLTKEGKDDES